MHFNTQSILSVALMAGSALGHSWLECVKTTNIKKQGAALTDINVPLEQSCEGYPRNKVNNGDWIAESTHYLWDFKQHGGENAPACHSGQNKPGQADKAKAIAQVKPGETIKLRHWGNGHSRFNQGSPLNRDPGFVRVYWAGKKETELKNFKDLSGDKMIAEGNFSSPDAVILTNPANKMQLFEKGNYLDLKIPSNIETGRHMMVWTWAWEKNAFTNQWVNNYSTCFDIIVSGGSSSPAPAKGGSTDKTPAPATPAKSQTAPANPAAEKCAQACFRGGQTQYSCTGASCPPCRYAAGSNFNCFDYKAGSSECPWAGGYDCKANKSV